MNNSLFTLDDSPWFQWIELDEVDSTNNFLKHYRPASRKDMVVASAEYQTAGRGQTGNIWESSRGENLLFSVLLHPQHLEARNQFILSQAISLAIAETLCHVVADVSIKWPNDIYIGNDKVAGILIENTIMGHEIEECVMGVGINVNQSIFMSDAPNPTSLKLITGHEQERIFLLAHIVELLKSHVKSIARGDVEGIRNRYMEMLYRRNGVHRFKDDNGLFEASIAGVESSGHLLLITTTGEKRRYAFKEVSWA